MYASGEKNNDKTTGLSAAKLLTDHDVDVTVLEARGRVGGRTFTVKVRFMSLFFDNEIRHVVAAIKPPSSPVVYQR